MEIVFVFLMMCGRVDTVLIKRPDQVPTYNTKITEKFVKDLNQMITPESVIIIHSDKRIKCI